MEIQGNKRANDSARKSDGQSLIHHRRANGFQCAHSFLISNHGFTIMEMIIVVVIAGVLASIALPNFTMATERVRSAEGTQILEALLNAQRVYMLENGVYALVSQVNLLDVQFPAPDNFKSGAEIKGATDGTNGNQVAKVTRSDDSYELCISNLGVITCEGTICSNLGAQPLASGAAFITGTCA